MRIALGRRPTARAAHHRPTGRSDAQPRTGRTPTAAHPRGGTCSARQRRSVVATCGPRARTHHWPPGRPRPGRQSDPVPQSSKPPRVPARAPGSRSRPGGGRGPTRRTRRRGSGGSNGPGSDGRPAPVSQTVPDASWPRRPGPAGRAAWYSTPDPGHRRSGRNGTSPPPGPGPCEHCLLPAPYSRWFPFRLRPTRCEPIGTAHRVTAQPTRASSCWDRPPAPTPGQDRKEPATGHRSGPPPPATASTTHPTSGPSQQPTHRASPPPRRPGHMSEPGPRTPHPAAQQPQQGPPEPARRQP